MTVISFAVPTIMAAIKRVRAGTLATSGTDVETGSSDVDEQKVALLFPRHTKIRVLFESENSLAKVHTYVAKSQMLEYSWTLLFLEELKRYLNLPDASLPFHAELKKQKFLVKNAYIPLICVSQETKDEVIEYITKATNIAAEQEKTSNQEMELAKLTSGLRGIFSGPQMEVEDHLARTLFKGFFVSDEWKSLDSESTIRTTMDEMSTNKA